MLMPWVCAPNLSGKELVFLNGRRKCDVYTYIHIPAVYTYVIYCYMYKITIYYNIRIYIYTHTIEYYTTVKKDEILPLETI